MLLKGFLRDLPAAWPDKREADLIESASYLQGSGYPKMCSGMYHIVFCADGVQVISARSVEIDAQIPFGELSDLSIWGPGRRTSSPGIVGGGFGAKKAAEGIIAATVINSLLTTTSCDTYFRLETAHGEMQFHVNSESPEQLRSRLSRVFTALRNRQQTSYAQPLPEDEGRGKLVQRLEKLSELRREGMLSDEEFAQAKAELLSSDTKD